MLPLLVRDIVRLLRGVGETGSFLRIGLRFVQLVAFLAVVVREKQQHANVVRILSENRVCSGLHLAAVLGLLVGEGRHGQRLCFVRRTRVHFCHAIKVGRSLGGIFGVVSRTNHRLVNVVEIVFLLGKRVGFVVFPIIGVPSRGRRDRKITLHDRVSSLAVREKLVAWAFFFLGS